MAKFLVVGDVHLSRKRVERSRLLLNRITEQARKVEDLTGIILLGDVFDTHDVQDNECLTLYSDFILENEEEREIHHLVGNHEMNDSRTYLPSVHSLTPWRKRDNVFIHEKPNVRVYDGCNLMFVPFVPNGMFAKAVEGLGKPTVAFAHQEFLGCKMGSHDSTTGDPDPGFPVISGHIHGAQKLGNIWYPGTPCQQNFAEGKDKYIYLMEFKDDKFKVLEKIDLGLPKMITIRISATEDFEIPEGTEDSYRVVVKDTPENIVVFKGMDKYKEAQKLVKFKFDVVKGKAERVELEKKVSFQERFVELVKKEGLKETYEDIFEKFQESPEV